jgi:hypothetical protein
MKSPRAQKPRPPDDPAQSDRFISTAKEIEVDESGVSFERVMKAVAPEKTGKPSTPKPKPKRKIG